MRLNETIYAWLNRSKKEREIGRYWASELYKIRKGYMKPAEFFERKPIMGRGVGLVSQGIAGEDFLAKVLKDMEVEFEPQAPFEIKLKSGIVVSGKADFKFKDKVIEVKAPANPLLEIPERYEDQLLANHIGFNLPVYLCEVLYNPFRVNIFAYMPNMGLWEAIQESLEDFHREVEEVKRLTDERSETK